MAFADNTALTIAIEGDPHLLNRYDVIELNPKKHGKPWLAVAKPLADWLASPEGQQAIEAYQKNGEKLFNASAASPKKTVFNFRLEARIPNCCMADHLRYPCVATIEWEAFNQFSDQSGCRIRSALHSTLHGIF